MSLICKNACRSVVVVVGVDLNSISACRRGWEGPSIFMGKRSPWSRLVIGISLLRMASRCSRSAVISAYAKFHAWVSVISCVGKEFGWLLLLLRLDILSNFVFLYVQFERFGKNRRRA